MTRLNSRIIPVLLPLAAIGRVPIMSSISSVQVPRAAAVNAVSRGSGRQLQSRRGPAVPRLSQPAFALTLPSLSEQLPVSSAKFFSSPVDFLLGASALEQFPEAPSLGSIAFAGRSNVGKSSMVNALFHSSKLARVSKTPGRTQELNFFAPKGAAAHVVDFPGYGWAEHSSKEKAQSWQAVIGEYARLRSSSIKTVCILLDARRGLTQLDVNFMTFLNSCAVPFQCVVTKIDKVSSRDYIFLMNIFRLFFRGHLELSDCTRMHRSVEKGGADALAAIADAEQSIRSAPIFNENSKLIFPECAPLVHVTSAHTLFGLPELRATVAARLGIRQPSPKSQAVSDLTPSGTLK